MAYRIALFGLYLFICLQTNRYLCGQSGTTLELVGCVDQNLGRQLADSSLASIGVRVVRPSVEKWEFSHSTFGAQSFASRLKRTGIQAKKIETLVPIKTGKDQWLLSSIRIGVQSRTPEKGVGTEWLIANPVMFTTGMSEFDNFAKRSISSKSEKLGEVLFDTNKATFSNALLSNTYSLDNELSSDLKVAKQESMEWYSLAYKDLERDLESADRNKAIEKIFEIQFDILLKNVKLNRLVRLAQLYNQVHLCSRATKASTVWFDHPEFAKKIDLSQDQMKQVAMFSRQYGIAKDKLEAKTFKYLNGLKSNADTKFYKACSLDKRAELRKLLGDVPPPKKFRSASWFLHVQFLKHRFPSMTYQPIAIDDFKKVGSTRLIKELDFYSFRKLIHVEKVQEFADISSRQVKEFDTWEKENINPIIGPRVKESERIELVMNYEELQKIFVKQQLESVVRFVNQQRLSKHPFVPLAKRIELVKLVSSGQTRVEKIKEIIVEYDAKLKEHRLKTDLEETKIEQQSYEDFSRILNPRQREKLELHLGELIYVGKVFRRNGVKYGEDLFRNLL